MPTYTVNRKDKAEKDIVQVLRDVGASVEYWTKVDLIVGYRGVNYLIEVKNPGDDLRPVQKKWHDNWRGYVMVAHTPEDALKIIGAIRT